MKNVLFCLLVIITGNQADAQIFNSVLREAQRKLERKIEDKIVDAVSDEIARRAFRPVEASMDSMMRRSYQDSVNHGEKVDWNKAGKAYGEFLAGMNEAVDLPETYSFDIEQEVELTQYDDKKANMTMYYSSDKAIYGIESHKNEKETHLILMDLMKDVMVMYSTSKKGKKQAQTFANVSRFSKSMASAVADSTTARQEYRVAKTGKSKKVAGYHCEEYKLTSQKMEMLMYVTNDFPIKWHQKSSAYMGQFAPADYTMASQYRESGGLMLEYTATQLDGKKKTSTWTTKSIKKETYTIANKEYTFGASEK